VGIWLGWATLVDRVSQGDVEGARLKPRLGRVR